MFKLWSKIKKGAKNELAPDLGLRSWNDLAGKEKLIIWKYLNWYFFESNKSIGSKWEFFGDYQEKELKQKRIFRSIAALNKLYKAKNYTPSFLDDFDLDSACTDFRHIFLNYSENVVLELLSLYCRFILAERAEETPWRNEKETEKEFGLRTKEWRLEPFNNFAKVLNEVFQDFGINVHLTRSGFVPRQDQKIITGIYEPVLSVLSDPKWKEVDTLLEDAFDEYRKNTPQGYSNCVTNVVASMQAFLQIIVYGKTGKGDISKLISEAQTNGLIPNDFFTSRIFENLGSILARERQETSIAHPKKQYANEKNARMMLNLAMVFIQHCIQK